MARKKLRVNLSLSPEFWTKWKKFAEGTGLSASELIEMTGTAMIDGSAPLIDFMRVFEAKVGKPKGRKK